MQWALEKSYDVLVTMDADWSHDPCHLPDLVRATETADVAIGSRVLRGRRDRGLATQATNRKPLDESPKPANAATSRSRLKRRVSCLSDKLRCARIDLASIQASGYSYLEEILWHLHRAGASFREVPITFHERRAGKSKINFGEAMAKLITLRRLAWRRE